jgi:hypothetical protein
MKNMNNIKRIMSRFLLGGVLAVTALTACTDAVEKTDLGRVTDDVVWKDPKLVRGYFNNTMRSGPGPESRLLGHADECYKFESTTSVVYDEFNADEVGGDASWENIDRWPYEALRSINRFLDHAGHDGFVSSQPISPALPQSEKEDMVGQMLVLRAYHYFDLVRTYGGVPLLLHEQEAVSNFDELMTERAKTSACVEQIVKDLDDAIALPDASFPMKRSDGSIGKGVAYALKGRVLLYYASPQFTHETPAGTKPADQRWNEAYAACKEAYTKLTEAGFGLYLPDGGDRKTVMDNYYKLLVTDELNREMIWVRRFEPLVGANFGTDVDFRPNSASGRGIAPVWEMVSAFANADGTPFTGMQIDNSKGGTFGDMVEGSTATTGIARPDGSPINTSVFWLDREPRFYAFIGYNGCEWPLIHKQQDKFPSDVKDGKMQHEWLFCWGDGDNDPFDRGYNSGNDKGKGFFIRKFVRDDRNYELPGTNALKECGTDWPLFRFAEVMLNLAEAAAKTNHQDEAYAMLDAIRKRAGIPAANGYGLGRKTGDALILDILNERKIELFVESQRYYDVRRWRLYSDGLAGFKINGMRRHAILSWLKEPSEITNIPVITGKLQSIIDAGGIETQAGIDAYFDVFFHVVMMYDIQGIKYNPDRQDFLRIPYNTHIRKNPLIQQTRGWTDTRGQGTFNPYE